MANELTKADFNGAGSMIPSAKSAAAVVASSGEVARVLGGMQVAHAFPRDEVKSRDRALAACTVKTLAAISTYQYSRGGTDITGPSIRLMEAIARAWGNLDCGFRTIETTAEKSTVEAYCIDLETNARFTKQFDVSHVRHTKRGDTLLTDPRDIYEIVANNAMRRVRACIMEAIPGDFIDACMEECAKTLKASVDMKPDTIKKLVDAFAVYGVSKAQIEKKIQRHLDVITAAQVLMLRRIYTSLHDGMATAAEFFDPDPAIEMNGEDAKKPSSEAAKLAAAAKPKTKEKKSEDEGNDVEECI